MSITATQSPASSGSNEFRLFFLAMTPDERAECRSLYNAVWPWLQAACAERGVQPVFVDPLSGADGQDAFSASHVAGALKELYAGTYCIVVMGSRYGAAVDGAECPELLMLAERAPSLADALDQERSAGDVMISEGMLRGSERMRERAAFFVREDGAPADTGRAGRRLAGLKRKIRERAFDIRPYRKTEELVEEVRRGLEARLAARAPTDGAAARADRERREHAEFRRGYCPHYQELPGTHDALNSAAAGEITGPLWVLAPYGAGKTSLLVNWVREYLRRNPGALVIEHYVGHRSGSRNLVGFMQRVLVELRANFPIAEDVPQRAEEIIAAYSLWLSIERNRPVILVIDGVDGFEGGADIRAALPSVTASHLRIIVSARVASAESALSTVGAAHQLVLPGFTLKETQRLLNNQLAAGLAHTGGTKLGWQIARIPAAREIFHKTLLTRLLADPRLGRKEVQRLLERYRQATDSDALLDMVLGDLAARCPALPVRPFLRALWASEEGLPFEELAAVCEANGGAGAETARSLAAAFEAVLHVQDVAAAALDPHVRRAVQRRYVVGGVARSRARIELADILAAMPPSVQRAYKILSLLKDADDGGARRRMNRRLCLVETVQMFQADGRMHELVAYWAGHGGAEIERRYRVALERHAARRGDGSEAHAQGLAAVASLLAVAGRFEAAAELLGAEEKILKLGHASSGAYAVCLARLSEIRLTLGAVAVAGELLSQALAIQRDLGLDGTIEYAMTLRRLAGVLYTSERYDEALAALGSARDIVRRHADAHAELRLWIEADRAAVLYGKGKYADAESLLRDTLTACRTGLGERHTITLEVCNSLGAVCERQAIIEGEADGIERRRKRWLRAAREFRERALAISRELYPAGHSEITARMSNLGMQCRLEGEIGVAEALYREALAFDELTFGHVHSRIAGLLINLATLLRLQRSDQARSEALELLMRARDIRKRLRDTTATELSDVALNLASVLKELERFNEALKWYRAGVPVRVVQRGMLDRRTREALGGLVDLMIKMGRSLVEAGSVAGHRYWRACCARIAQHSPDLAVAIEHALRGELAAARRICRAIIRRCVRAGNAHDPELMEALELLAACTVVRGA